MIKVLIENEAGKFHEVQQWMLKNVGKGVNKNPNNKRKHKKWTMEYVQRVDPVTRIISFQIQINCKDPVVALMLKLQWDGRRNAATV